MDPRPDASDTTQTAAMSAVRSAAGEPFLSPPELPDEIGRLGTFRILAELGRGGMGVVFRAEDVGLKRLVALKVMLPSAAASPGAVARFLREAEAQAKVEHDHIIAIHRIDEANGVPFLAMPLLKGQTLDAALRQNRHPPVAEVVRIGREIADGLAAAHEAGLIHRDIKPANVWLEGGRRRVKILDFGLARVVHEPVEAEPVAPGASEAAAHSAHLTAVGAVLGTPAYMSPEQARGLPLDARTDLFSLGAVLYEMATGRRPFTGPNSARVIDAVISLHPQPAHELNPDVPAGLSELIRRLMAKDPKHRPASAAAVAEELEALGRGVVPLPVQVFAVGEVPGEPNPWADIADTNPSSAVTMPLTVDAAAPAPRPPAGGRKPLLFAAVAVLAAAAVVVAVVVAMNRNKGPRDADPLPVAEGPKPPAPKPKPKESPAPFQPTAFFSGKDLNGWNCDPNVWRAADGAIVGERLAYNHLSTRRAFSDYELSFSVSSPKPWSGHLLHFRCRVGEEGPQVVFASEGVSLNSRGKWTAPAAKVGATDRLTVRCFGKRVKIIANGTTLIDEDVDMAAEGPIGFQAIAVEGVTISDIHFTDLTPFFNGKNLTGWSSPSDEWKVVDGAIVAGPKVGLNVLGTWRAFGDFELSFRAKFPDPKKGWLGLVVRLDETRASNAGLSFWPEGIHFGTGTKRTAKAPLAKTGEANHVTIRCVGKRVTATANGVTLIDEECDIAPTGRFVFQGNFTFEGVTLSDITFTDLSEPGKK